MKRITKYGTYTGHGRKYVLGCVAFVGGAYKGFYLWVRAKALV